MQMLPMQNDFIKKFTVSNKIEDHMIIYSIRPLKNNPSLFQVFASVSPVLRQGLAHYRNKLTLGLTSCKVYDRQNIKRCNNCQHFGHYAKDCPTPETPSCGACGDDHATINCDSFINKCINCTRSKLPSVDHAANSTQCPSFLKQVKLSQSNHLNSINRNYIPVK